ncbi:MULTISPECIES: cysteine--1-D-myo-inosityl 2-amino-2-deoxy-alpha-D-glucopyranoside ligase [unclassified Nocardioides]|uniref:cysteine--1-D-myo-inosityl 2-amino-2-deoxy-alpha-D-glucopyranoside ligase n=1 Tax=unclassified Nocardioides TaxID=2615069 RepID=UPI0007037AC5|nr:MULTISPECIES: cysteine--1-D-myo-inosityl 2-amino-2-deoxy-alpha-D-glucopyranoside ligase [unclassified Nocardioides]KQP65140.1 cysteine--1-D-myo-inosityl 2-amino-2-deoxy-alpha-D-glucopyranoside ligase [Nocardioides sp. Leaf285]KQQ43884.1 cysteine--1-D-myo-inosityl 2-amino-2-deoxy-alpha-D-glucopyranoside ligase [Nocardioides sp. Leaf307]
MRAWPAPEIPTLPVKGPAVALHDTPRGELVTTTPTGAARLYVCGITPYDATHMGHAATYVAYDLLNRAWRSAGHDVTYVQNVTDVDDPLLERATKVHVEWTALAERETELFRQDMTALRVLPPAEYVGAVESIPLVVALVERLQAAGAVYRVEDDLYFSVTADPAFGEESGLDREAMLRIFPERGGDPERPGKRDPLDCVVWRGEREGEPSWPSPFGPGRPGWHVECTAIAMEHLGGAFDVQAGGSDLVFPHHEMCAGHAQVAEPGTPFAQVYSHAGMVAYDGEKMSKSRGNLVFVSALRNSDVDPMAIRATLLRHHYRSDWEWTDAELFDNVDRLAEWRKAIALGAGAPAEPVVTEVLAALADDLDAPRALAAVDAWVDATLGTHGLADTSDPDAARSVHVLLDAALGLAL